MITVLSGHAAYPLQSTDSTWAEKAEKKFSLESDLGSCNCIKKKYCLKIGECINLTSNGKLHNFYLPNQNQLLTCKVPTSVPKTTTEELKHYSQKIKANLRKRRVVKSNVSQLINLVLSESSYIGLHLTFNGNKRGWKRNMINKNKNE